MKKILFFLICIQITLLPVFAEYDFSDEAQAEFDRNKNQQSSTVDFTKKRDRTEIKSNTEKELLYDAASEIHERPLYGSVVKIPAGTAINITFDSGISSGSSEKNDRLTAKLTHDFRYNEILIAPAGSLVYGVTTASTHAGYAYGSGSIEINFNEILTPDGNLLKISTENIYMEEKNERVSKMTRDVVVSTAGSLLLGAAITAINGGHNWGRNMLIFGAVGAANGGIRGALHQGKDIYIPNGTSFNLILTEPLNTSQYLGEQSRYNY